MTHPLPDKITDMTTPDGRPAFRVLRAKPAAAPKPENAKMKDER